MSRATENIKYYNQRTQYYREQRQNVIDGKLNSIPIPFPNFSRVLPGIERAKYYLVTANQKGGKTKFTNFLFVLNVLLYAFKNKDAIKVKIFYYSLEMSKESLYDQFTIWWLHIISKGTVSINEYKLNSINRDNLLDEEIFTYLMSKEYTEFFDFIEDHLEVEVSVRNPYGIYKRCEEYANETGVTTYKQIESTDKFGNVTTRPIKESYTPNDAEEYKILVVDHFSLITEESGMDLRQTMKKFSSKDLVYLRNFYKFTEVIVQQQGLAQEGTENFKLDLLKPSASGLESYKDSSKDCNVMLGLFDPHRHKIKNYNGYNIAAFKNNIRFLEVLYNRNGNANVTTALYFDGAVNIFKELPPPNTPEIRQVEQYLLNRRTNNN